MWKSNLVEVPQAYQPNDLIVDENEKSPSWISGEFTNFVPKVLTTGKRVTTREIGHAYKSKTKAPFSNLLYVEIKITSKLRHPNVLKLFGVGELHHKIIPVYERIYYGSLHFLLYKKRNRLSFRLVTDLVIQICQALQYVHSKGLVHGGISSHAVMMVKEGVFKLSCFEHAVVISDKFKFNEGHHKMISSIEHVNVLRHWMAPELLTQVKHQYTVRSDVYSMCSVIWELCYGELPWKDATLSDLQYLFEEKDAHVRMNKKVIPYLWYHFMELGLKPDFKERDLEITEIHDMMVLSKKSDAVLTRGKNFCENWKSIMFSSSSFQCSSKAEDSIINDSVMGNSGPKLLQGNQICNSVPIPFPYFIKNKDAAKTRKRNHVKFAV